MDAFKAFDRIKPTFLFVTLEKSTLEITVIKQFLMLQKLELKLPVLNN